MLAKADIIILGLQQTRAAEATTEVFRLKASGIG